MGPLEQMYSILLQEHADREAQARRPVDFKNPVPSAFTPSRGQGPMPMRPPMQEGPSPPVGRGPLASMFGGYQ